MLSVFTPDSISRLVAHSGLTGALAGLFYPELHPSAGAKMNGQRFAHTWQSTTLLQELYPEQVRFQSGGATIANCWSFAQRRLQEQCSPGRRP